MKLPNVAVNVENEATATAGLVRKPKKYIQIGITIPPPPIPAIVERALITMKTIRPTISIGSTGKMNLWTQTSFLQVKN